MDKVFGSSGELPLPVPFRLLSVSNPFSEVMGFQGFRSPWALKDDCTGLAGTKPPRHRYQKW